MSKWLTREFDAGHFQIEPNFIHISAGIFIGDVLDSVLGKGAEAWTRFTSIDKLGLFLDMVPKKNHIASMCAQDT